MYIGGSLDACLLEKKAWSDAFTENKRNETKAHGLEGGAGLHFIWLLKKVFK